MYSSKVRIVTTASILSVILLLGSSGIVFSPPPVFAENPRLLLIDEDSIDNNGPINGWTARQVNDDITTIGLRAVLPAFSGTNIGSMITIPTGQLNDEGWFEVASFPDSWAAIGPTGNGFTNFVGVPVGLGLGGPGLPGDEILGKVYAPALSGRQRIHVFAKLVTIERHARLDPQRIPCAEPGRFDDRMRLFRRPKQFGRQERHQHRRQDHLHAVLSRIARSGDHELHWPDLPDVESVATDRRKVPVG